MTAPICASTVCASTIPAHRSATRGVFAIISAAFKNLRVALIVQRERRGLLQMDAAMLDDIGLTQDEAAIEAARALWDVPSTWRRTF